MTNPLQTLSGEGVAVWLDDISRERLRSGNLKKLIDERSVVGVTSNPTIFDKALKEGDAYDDQLRDLAVRGVSVDEAVRAITAYDIRWAADVLRDTYEATGRLDGRVSLEVDPRLARDTERTAAEARALWWLVDRPNLFIKIPATAEGLPAITQALSEGINVNVTLIFSLERYRGVMDAFLSGLEKARENGLDVSQIQSVASFFVSRVDTEIDKRLEKIGTDEAAQLRGRAAIANARLAYQAYEEVFSSERWKALAAAGASPQRPLWASTGVKDPSYDDTRYVTQLVAPGTVNTMPEATLEATADHAEITGDTVRGTYAQAQADLDAIAALGIDYEEVVKVLEDEGVDKFAKSWEGLLARVTEQLNRQV
ncbi:transaldolase [Streptomonospora nanhaiensis]|uniref:Transaldolase n=1 Tax=Streptomonospora nanhaiensis TaxID=1323731 RepID=A0A853BVD4_9ACTN|nr:transaldolase [Streptomonospora nanhaiensis]MBV2365576.1 transaldolase [Streptomonospora nanhaiensis]MBX9387130.1 transaldolase [Streptomonospora nanhaiensis]NYI98930.1 transaldolase [Streptomonospora nanhaiensis]